MQTRIILKKETTEHFLSEENDGEFMVFTLTLSSGRSEEVDLEESWELARKYLT